MTIDTTDSSPLQPLPPPLSLIIAVYNQPKFLRWIFLSLLNQTFKDFETVIADDGSGEAIDEVVAEFQPMFRRPILHIRHDNLGFRKTVIANRSVESAGAEYLVFTDGDCILHHRFIERHYARRRRGTVLSGRRVSLDAILTNRLTDEDIGTRRIERISFWRGHCSGNEARHGIYVPLLFRLDGLFRKTWPILGCNFSLYKKDFLAVNGYDERIIGRGMEDSNLYERMRVKKLRFRNLSREAIQYHAFHKADPVPHSAETIRQFTHPTEYWTEFGMVKGPEK
jgi:glycosyltransferase involved in cell wall biosynthesis